MDANFRVLVVDDNESAAKSLQKLLTLRGHEVVAVFTGEDAISSLSQVDPDVILLDIGLPYMDGYEVARRLRNEHKYEGVIVALTGYGQDADKEHAEGAGINFHLTKPAGLSEIEEVLAKVTR
jgi:CheY-like chemotaxis protein